MKIKQYYNINREDLTVYIRPWVSYFSGCSSLPESRQDRGETMHFFGVSYLEELLQKESWKIYKDEDSPSNDIVDLDTRTIKVPKSLFVREYKDRVYRLLEENKNEKDPNKRFRKKLTI